MQVTIARQLGLDPSTVSNFFMNARRRSIDKWREDPPEDGEDNEDANEDPEDDYEEDDQDEDLNGDENHSPASSTTEEQLLPSIATNTNSTPLHQGTSQTLTLTRFPDGTLKASQRASAAAAAAAVLVASSNTSNQAAVVHEMIHPHALVSPEALAHQESLDL